MPLPKPKPGEKYRNFMKRFLKDKEVKKKFPNIKQRFAVAITTLKNYTRPERQLYTEEIFETFPLTTVKKTK